MSKAARIVTNVLKQMGAKNVTIVNGRAISADFNGNDADRNAKNVAQTLRGAGVGSVNICGHTVQAFL